LLVALLIDSFGFSLVLHYYHSSSYYAVLLSQLFSKGLMGCVYAGCLALHFQKRGAYLLDNVRPRPPLVFLLSVIRLKAKPTHRGLTMESQLVKQHGNSGAAALVGNHVNGKEENLVPLLADLKTPRAVTELIAKLGAPEGRKEELISELKMSYYYGGL
jgi:hypothetical protein